MMQNIDRQPETQTVSVRVKSPDTSGSGRDNTNSNTSNTAQHLKGTKGAVSVSVMEERTTSPLHTYDSDATGTTATSNSGGGRVSPLLHYRRSNYWQRGGPEGNELYMPTDSYSQHPEEGAFRPFHDFQQRGNGFDDRYMTIIGDAGFWVTSVVTQRILTHPLLVFQNQSQINSRVEGSYHLFVPSPWSPILPLYNIYKNQGAVALWKGLTTDIIEALSTKAIEMVISENSTLPLSLNSRSSKNVTINLYFRHVLLKCISSALTSPLVCAGYVLRVQSQVVAADTSYFSIFTEAYQRIASSIFAYNVETSHLLPIYQLVFPITALRLGSYILQGMALATVRRQYQMDSISLDDSEHDEVPVIKVIYDKYYPQLLGMLSGNLLADVFLYPLSTVTGRLILQGTRTIIDDVDSGNAVLPVTSSYTGVWDCLNTIRQEEGIMGLYKGFGTLVMRYTVQFMILRGCHLLYEKIMDTHYPRVPRRNLHPSTSSSTYSSVASLNTKT